MGRKKKTPTIEETENKVENKPTEAVSVNASSLGYSGEITVKVANGNKIVSARKLHNKGMLPLFKFLVNCLGGMYTETLRPCKIKLFNFDHETTGDTPSSFNWATAFNEKDIDGISPYIIYDVAPKIKMWADEADITYHFRVPCAYLSGVRANVVGFYSSNIIDDVECSAFYLFTKTENNALTWDDLDFSDLDSNNFSIIIDWTMKVSNKDIITA